MKITKILNAMGVLTISTSPIPIIISCSNKSENYVNWANLITNWQKLEGFKNSTNEPMETKYLAYYVTDFSNFNKYFKDENGKAKYDVSFAKWFEENKKTSLTTGSNKTNLPGNYKSDEKIPEYKGIAKLFYAWSKMHVHYKNDYKDWTQITAAKKKEITDPIFKSLYTMYNRKQKQSSVATGGFSTMDEFYWVNRSKFWNDLKKWATLYNIDAFENRSSLKGITFPNGKVTNIYKGSKDILNVIKYALSSIVDDKFYYRGQQQYVNWWFYEIGFPRYIFNFILPIIKDTTTTERVKYLSGYNYFKSDPLYGRTAPTAINNYRPSKKMLSTGANLADNALNGLKAAILNNDIRKLKHSTNIMFEYIFKKFSQSDDGFYRDGGFIQHSNVPYIGTYGAELLKAVAKTAYILEGSNQDLFNGNPQFMNIFPIMQKSIMPFIYRGVLSSAVGGRGITRAGSEYLGIGIIKYMSMLEKFSYGMHKVNLRNFLAQNINQMNDDASKLNDSNILKIGWEKEKKNKFISKWIGKSYTDKIDYNKNSLNFGIDQIQSIDRILVRRKDWAMSTSFHSSRIGNFEGMNGENLQGMYQGDGMSLLQTKRDSNPFTSQYWWGVNPYRLPGTTSDTSTKSVTDADIKNEKDEWRSWIDKESGKSLLGLSGGTNMDNIGTSFGVYSNFNEKISTKKSMFILEDEIYVLGKTNSWESNGKISTTIDNRMGGSFENKDNNYIYTSDNGSKIGYRIMGSNNIMVDSENARKAWLSNRRYYKEKNNERYAKATTKKFNSLRVEHDNEQNSTFEYAITPNVNSFTKMNNLQTRINVIENNASRQAIEYTNSKGEEYLMVNYLAKSSGNGSYKFLFSPAMKKSQLAKATSQAERNEINKMAIVEIKSGASSSFIFKRYKVNGTYRYKMSANTAEVGNAELKIKFNKEVTAFKGPFKKLLINDMDQKPNLDVEEAISNWKIETQWAEKSRIELQNNIYFTDSQSLTLHFDKRYKFNKSIQVEFTLGE